jgi:hypothetical protein
VITDADVAAWLKLTADPLPEALTVAVASVNATARRRCLDVLFDSDGDGEDDDPIILPSDLKLGLIMQAARLYRRSETPDGIAGFADEGTAVRVVRFDPDIDAQLIDFLKPQVA